MCAYVNTVPLPKIKREPVDDSQDVVHCRLCYKGFASKKALNNHVRMEHFQTYCMGDPAVWTQENVRATGLHANAKVKIDEEEVKKKTEEVLQSLQPMNIMSLASNDVSYIIIKAEDAPSPKKKKTEKKEEREKVVKKEKDPQVITGPFECLQPSTLSADVTCHQIFFSCCEYSLHFRDEHNRRRKGLRCQVCEKPLVCSSEDAAPYSCEICGEGFQTGEQLTEHAATIHIKLKPYECNICHKRFTQQGGVLQHMRMHTGDKPFPCTFCAKAFTQKSGLEQHLRIHTKVKPYRCVVCSKSFCQSVHLKQHMRTHTNVAPFQCGICDKRFKQSSHLNYHLKNHNPASLTPEQRARYAELVGVVSAEVVEVEVVESMPDIHMA